MAVYGECVDADVRELLAVDVIDIANTRREHHALAGNAAGVETGREIGFSQRAVAKQPENRVLRPLQDIAPHIDHLRGDLAVAVERGEDEGIFRKAMLSARRRPGLRTI